MVQINTLTIRNVPNDVVAKFDDMRSKSDKKISRDEYIRMLLMQNTMGKEIQEVASDYEELVRATLRAIENNSNLLTRLIEGLNM